MRATVFALLIVAISASPADAMGSHKHHGPPLHGNNKGSEQMHAALHKATEALKAEGKTIDEEVKKGVFEAYCAAHKDEPGCAKGAKGEHHGPPRHGGGKFSEQMHAALHKAFEALKAEGKTIDEEVKKGVFEAYCAAHKDEPGCAKGKHHGKRHGGKKGGKHHHGGKKGLRGANGEHGPQRDPSQGEPSQGKTVEGTDEMSAALGAAERDGMDASDEEWGDEAEDEGEDDGEGGRRGPPVGGILAGVCALAGVVGAAVVARKRARSRNAAAAPANLTPVPMQASNQVALVPQGKGGDYHDML